MNPRLIHLRIKIKSLAAESVIIRQEARRVKGDVRRGLNEHKTNVVRVHTRYNLLAYGFLKGLKYQEMEKKCDVVPNFIKVKETIRTFGTLNDHFAIHLWIEDAKVYLALQGHTPASLVT